MDGSAEVNESMDNSAEAPQAKRKENDPLHSQTENYIALQNPTPAIVEDIGWIELLSSLRSPEMLLETLAGKGPHHDLVAHSVSGPPTSSCPSRFPGSIMKELRLRNFKLAGTNISGCSGNAEDSPIRKGLWQNLTRIAGGSRINSLPRESLRLGDSKKAVGSPISLEKKNLQLPQFSLNQLKAPNDVIEIDSQDLSRINLTKQPPVIRTSVLPASGFRQFLAKTTLKGKGIKNCPQGTFNDPEIVTTSQNDVGIYGNKVKTFESVHKQIAKEDEIVLLGGGGGNYTDSNLHHNRSSLRDWLKIKHDLSNKHERLRMFKQILVLVDVSHAQGLVLQQLKPSYFVLFPSGLVEYIGSVNTQAQAGDWSSSKYVDVTQERHLKRKRPMGYDEEHQASLSQKQIKQVCGQEIQGTLKHKLAGQKNQMVAAHHIHPFRIGMHESLVEEAYDGNIRTASFDVRFSEQIQLIDSYQSSSIPGCQNSFPHFREPVSGFLNLEDTWYASPENLNESACSLSSNIYSLGVLFFELFCSFEMEEMHFTAMANLRHRILPPNFLSESPKEAGFCLWLLHPDPSSRPKSREILLSNLIVEINKISAKDQPSATIDEENAEADLLSHFLSSLKEQKENRVAKLLADIQCLETDVEEVERRHLSRVCSLTNARGSLDRSNENSDICPHEMSILIGAKSSWSVSSVNEEKMMNNIDQLEHAYFSMRSNFDLSETNVATRSDVGVLKIRDNFRYFRHKAGIKEESADRVGAFFEGLCKYARYNRFEVCGSLRNVDILNSANVICSLSFDRDEDYFATAGVSKKIKIFEFGALLSDTVDVHYPLIEMSSRSKLSCVSWNSYIKNYLASTDYDGVVQLWDVTTGQGFTQYSEHEKRAWSVDFSPVDPTKLASGSDDCSVKLWTIKERNCIDTIRNVANVCCVQFSPYSSHLLTFGSADYKIYCYDLRNTRSPWSTLSGHGKAVSYVKFVDCETLVSASTDNTLKLWDLNKSSSSGLSTNACSLTFTGHTNEKNFVGLTAFDGYIACGSETNEVFSYYRALPMPITSHKFGFIDPITGQETGDDNGQFVSSVCWRTKSNMVVAANSSGSLKLLQLV